MHVAIDARLPDSGQGGVLQVLRQLALSFSLPEAPTFQRSWIVYQGTTWWKELLPPGDDVIEVAPPFGRLSLTLAQRAPKLVSLMFPILRVIQRDQEHFDEELRAREVDLVHLPFQDGLLTNLPSVYNPHDLQHRYFPENFSRSQISHRETLWKRRARRAAQVMAASNSVKKDLEELWEIPSDRIQVVPIPPPERFVPDEIPGSLSQVPQPFLIYPAVFWPHKNHLRLIQAMNLLQQDGVFIDLLLTGAKGGNYRDVAKAVDELPSPERIRFLGHVTNSELSWLIANATLMVVPSLFEAMSLTVWDAQRLGTAVACSSVDPFPQQVGDSAVLFDSYDIEDMASTIKALIDDAEHREALVERAAKRVSNLTPLNYANAMYGIYLKALHREVPEFAIRSSALLNSVLGDSH